MYLIYSNIIKKFSVFISCLRRKNFIGQQGPESICHLSNLICRHDKIPPCLAPAAKYPVTNKYKIENKRM